MIVVADTSAINYLILLNRIAILETMYRRILIPPAVHAELLRPKAPVSVRKWAKNPPHWLTILSPPTGPHLFAVALDQGESEAIVLAQELRADWLVIDEAAGRDEAARRGLQTIGTLGILREAHRAGLLNLQEEIGRLRALGFRVSQPLTELLMDSL